VPIALLSHDTLRTERVSGAGAALGAAVPGLAAAVEAVGAAAEDAGRSVAGLASKTPTSARGHAAQASE
jgi:hypothetical protein